MITHPARGITEGITHLGVCLRAAIFIASHASAQIVTNLAEAAFALDLMLMPSADPSARLVPETCLKPLSEAVRLANSNRQDPYCAKILMLIDLKQAESLITEWHITANPQVAAA